MKRYIHILTLIAIFYLSACQKYLDKKEDAIMVVPSTLNDLQAIIDNGQQSGFTSPSLSESYTDDYYVPDDLYNSFDITSQQTYTWGKLESTESSQNDWLKSYRAIYYTNLVLEYLNKIKRDNTNKLKWDEIRGSALFFKSYHFLNLLWQYAKTYDDEEASSDLGIVLKNTSDFNVQSTRSTVEQSYNQVIDGAKESIDLLPNYPLVVTRPSKGSAYALLSRVYLSMCDYKNASKYADSALKLNNQLIDFNNDEDIVTESLAEDAPFKQYNKEIILYCEMNTYYDLFTNKGYIDTAIIDSYDPNDLRKVAYFREEGIGRYHFKSSYTGNTYSNFTGLSTDELYLIRAECYIRDGSIEEGLKDLNYLLEHRYRTGSYKTLTNLSKDEALKAVLKERRKELIFRGNRWSDIKRLNREGENITLRRNLSGSTFQLEPSDNLYAVPIPDDIIAITGIKQN